MSRQKIRIAFILTQFELGGAQKHLLSLLERLDPERFHPILLTSAEPGPLTPYAKELLGDQLIEIASLRREVNPVLDLKAGREIFSVLQAHPVDLVHTHSSKAGILGRWGAHRAGIKNIIHTVHGFGFTPEQPLWERRLYIGMEQRAAAVTNRMIAVSKTVIEEGCRYNIGVRSQYQWIPCGIDPKEFEIQSDGTVGATRALPLRIREELKIPPESPLITMVACFKPQKAPLDFVRAAAKVAPDFPQAKFLIVGDGVLRPQIERERERFHLVGATHASPLLILAGWRRDIPAILAASQVVILTSRWEGLPVTLLEAMASRKPIVATAVGGTPEIVQDGENGFLSSPGDIEAIARSICRLLKNPEEAAAMGECGRKRLSVDYEVTETVRRLENLYEELHSSIPCLTLPY